MRYLKILEFALSSLLRHKGKNLSILLVYTLIVSILASVLLVTHALKTEAINTFVAAPDLIIQRTVAGRHDLIPAGDAEVIKRIAGVGDVTPRIWGYYYDALTGANYTICGSQAPQLSAQMFTGAMPTGAGQCAIGTGVAALRGLEIGDELVLIDSTNLGVAFEVTGIFTVASNLLTNDLIILPEAEVRKFFGIAESAATDIAVRVYNTMEIETIAGKIKKAIPLARPITRQEILRTYDAVFNWRSGMLLALLSSSLIAFCLLAWDKATGISGAERQEIGILKAIGWDTADILLLKFWEGFVISVTALLLGLIIAYCHVFYGQAGLLAVVLKGWSVLFPQFHLVPYIDVYQLCTLAVITVAPYMASTLIPSWKAAVTDPDSVMR
jgi:ABC-type lipoprotein release transport system permease subunit